jgi:hypothetical protein
VRFSDTVETVDYPESPARPFTQLVRDFEKSADGFQAKGGSVLWDAIGQSLTNILAVRQGGKYAGVKYPRILVLSDGADEGSTTNKVALAQALVKNGVYVDCIFVSVKEAAEGADLTKLCHLVVFHFKSPSLGLHAISLKERLSYHWMLDNQNHQSSRTLKSILIGLGTNPVHLIKLQLSFHSQILEITSSPLILQHRVMRWVIFLKESQKTEPHGYFLN